MTRVFLALCRQPVMHSPQFRQAFRSGPTPPKNGSAKPLSRLGGGTTEEHPDRGRVEGVADAHVDRDLLHRLVGGGAHGVLDDAEHPLGLVVVRRELGLPVGDVRPRRVAVERVERFVERVRVDQRPAADTRAGHDQAVLDHVDALDAVAPGLRHEEEPLGVEGGVGEVLVLEPGTGLEDADPVALLGEPQRGDGAAEAGPDDQDVVVRGDHQARPSFFISRSWAVITLA